MEIKKDEFENRKRAVSYSRVSTEEEKQLNALEKQIQENREVIERMGWRLAGEYIDEGKSGTQTRQRNDYLRLFQDLEADRFDIVVIKDQDRLMRNPKDWYLFIDKLLLNRKQLYIHLDDSFYNPDNALITGIKAILAEEYSRHLSRKINNAHRNRQIRGDSLIITNRTYGYQNQNGSISVDEAERPIVELIYRMYANGKGARLICKELADRGYRNRSGNVISENVIREIVRNPLYKGTAVMNKRHLDFNTKKVLDVPEEKWIYHEEKVAPIVDADLWEAANRTIDRNCARSRGRKIGKKTGQNTLSGKVVCGECGCAFWRNQRRQRGTERERSVAYWYCSAYYRYGKQDGRQKNGCNSLRLKEDALYGLLEEMGKDLLPEGGETELQERILSKIAGLLGGTQDVCRMERFQKEEKELNAKKTRLTDLLVDGILSKEEYAVRMQNVEESFQRLCETKRRAEEEARTKAGIGERLEALRQRIGETGEKKVYGAAVPWMAAHVEVMKVYENRVEIHLDLGGRKRQVTAAAAQEGRQVKLSLPV